VHFVAFVLETIDEPIPVVCGLTAIPEIFSQNGFSAMLIVLMQLGKRLPNTRLSLVSMMPR
jgi:hypothetical protein